MHQHSEINILILLLSFSSISKQSHKRVRFAQKGKLSLVLVSPATLEKQKKDENLNSKNNKMLQSSTESTQFLFFEIRPKKVSHCDDSYLF